MVPKTVKAMTDAKLVFKTVWLYMPGSRAQSEKLHTSGQKFPIQFVVSPETSNTLKPFAWA